MPLPRWQQPKARVISVAHRQISATRNAGARQATGEVFFFVDADTLVNGPVVHSALAAMRAGAVGGGCVPEFEGRIPWWSRVAYPLGVAIVRLTSLSGGACQFCTRQAFERVGGFSEKHFAAEDAFFMRELKRHGRVVVPKERILTSGRSLRNHSLGKIARLLTCVAPAASASVKGWTFGISRSGRTLARGRSGRHKERAF